MYELRYTNELKHHGILGQKWGKKNGPPYPLDPEDHSASERKANYKLSIKKGQNDDVLSDRQKKAIKAAITVGATAAIAGLAVLGSKKVGFDIVKDRTKELGKKAVNKALNQSKAVGKKFVKGVPQGLEDFGDKAGKAVGFTLGVLAVKELSDLTGTTDKVKQIERTYNSNHKKDSKLNITNLNFGINVNDDKDDSEDEYKRKRN